MVTKNVMDFKNKNLQNYFASNRFSFCRLCLPTILLVATDLHFNSRSFVILKIIWLLLLNQQTPFFLKLKKKKGQWKMTRIWEIKVKVGSKPAATGAKTRHHCWHCGSTLSTREHFRVQARLLAVTTKVLGGQKRRQARMILGNTNVFFLWRCHTRRATPRDTVQLGSG